MHYAYDRPEFRLPQNPYLGGIGEPMNPLRFVDQAIALGPTRVMADPYAGYATMPRYRLAGRPMAGYADALAVFSAIDFLFP